MCNLFPKCLTASSLVYGVKGGQLQPALVFATARLQISFLTGIALCSGYCTEDSPVISQAMFSNKALPNIFRLAKVINGLLEGYGKHNCNTSGTLTYGFSLSWFLNPLLFCEL